MLDQPATLDISSCLMLQHFVWLIVVIDGCGNFYATSFSFTTEWGVFCHEPPSAYLYLFY